MTKKVKRILSNIFIVAAILLAIGYVVSRFTHFGSVEFTDNAQVCRQVSPVNSRVQGYIKEIRFKDFQHVKKGDTLVIIDDTEFRLHLAQAEAAVANAHANRGSARAAVGNAQAARNVTAKGVSTIQNNTVVTDANIAEVEVLLKNAQADYERYKTLYEQNAVTKQQLDAMATQYESLKAKVKTLHKQRQSAVLASDEQKERVGQTASGIDVAKANADAASATVEVAEAALALARQNLSYTIIIAPADGIVGKKEISVGQLVQPGQTLVSVVESDDVWVIANFRETQLEHIAVGNEVEIKVDALAGKSVTGTVERLSNATGASFSLIPQDNATGNFVKVEQRVPVRISLKGNSPEVLSLLKSGLNVECEVKY